MIEWVRFYRIKYSNLVITRVFVLNPPPLVSKIWDFFRRLYYLQKKSAALRAAVLLFTKLPEFRVGGFIIYKNVPQNQSLFGPFFDGFPLNSKQKPRNFSRASRAGFLLFTKILARFARSFIIYKNFLPRFARSFCAKRPLRPCAQSKLDFRSSVRRFVRKKHDF